jgi:hypothetical protein
MQALLIHNRALSKYVKQNYSLDEVHDLRSYLEEKQVFHFPALDNGLFPAGQFTTGAASVSGYNYVWVRDNCHIAHAHYVNGKISPAVENVRSAASYFYKHKARFEDIIEGRSDPHEPMNRPHIRFAGDRLEEIQQKWAHAQNDALGYFLWLYCLLVADRACKPSPEELELLARFVAYFRTIRFWQDEDSGHWEEVRKIGASSLGVVIGALRKLKNLLIQNQAYRDVFRASRFPIDIDEIDQLLAYGEQTLHTILPAECRQSDKEKFRLYDAALLFLIYPIAVVDEKMGEEIVTNVTTYLQGDYGIRRYQGDSYWCADYKERLRAEERTKDFSDELAQRNALLKEGQEAQWCLFDPIVSVIHGQRFCQMREQTALQQQVYYLNRSLGQITEDNKCPEAYYLEHGQYVANDHTPLLWTQANLWVALQQLEKSVSIAVGKG